MPPSRRPGGTATAFALAFLATVLFSHVSAYRVAISDEDQLRQTCSGMWAGKDTSIDCKWLPWREEGHYSRFRLTSQPSAVNFERNSSGTVATIFYEWSDFDKLGADGPDRDVFGEALKTYICDPQAVKQKTCQAADVGNFITQGTGPSIQKQRVDLGKSLEKEQTLVSSKD